MLRYSCDMTLKTIPWELVEQLLKERGRSREWFESELDVRTNNVSNWKARGVPKNRAAEIANILGTTSDYLLQRPGAAKDIGPSTAAAKPPPQFISDVETAPDLVGRVRVLPVVGKVQAGPDGLLSIDDYPVGFGDGEVEYWATCENAYALRVRGESMSPRYLPGEFVAVDPCSDVQPSQEVIVLMTNGSRMIKRMLWMRDGQACFESINKDYKNITLGVEDIQALHRVLGRVPPEAFRATN
jgi:phage repressor protein C with HTH and peptisase S24 domain